MNTETLVKQFTSVGLDVLIEDKPFNNLRGAEGIFMLDIQRAIKGNARSEFFKIYMGDPTNTIHIAASDKAWGQLVITIKEPSREFWEEIWKQEANKIDKLGVTQYIASQRTRTGREGNPKDIKKINGKWHLRQATPSQTRHMLIGRDERQLFMCRLPKACSSVKMAHDCLKAPEVRFADGTARGRTLRQGEWFLLNLTSEELAGLKSYLKSPLAIVHKKANIGQYAGRRVGKAHVAEELISMAGVPLSHGFTAQARNDVYVRGAISHPDHKTVKLGEWRKVIRNAERVESTGRAMTGSTWID